ncbi:MAG: hypothetical protein ACYDHW_13485 [Syntrophorhabdaceae bacterium]
MKFMKRIKKLEDLYYIPDIPRANMIQVITETTPEEIEAPRAELGRKYGESARTIIFVNTGVPRSFCLNDGGCGCDGECRENGGCKCRN